MHFIPASTAALLFWAFQLDSGGAVSVDVRAEAMAVLPHDHFHQLGSCRERPRPTVTSVETPQVQHTRKQCQKIPSTYLMFSTVTTPPSAGRRCCTPPDTRINLPPVLKPMKL